MFCSKCGSEVSKNAKFCGKCGTKNEPDSAVSTPKVAVASESKDIPVDAYNFWKSFWKINLITGVVILAFYWLIGSFEEDAGETFIGIIILTLVIGTLITLIRKWSKEKDAPRKVEAALTEEEVKKYEGLDGWLVLVCLGLFVTLGYGVFSFLETLGSVEDYGVSSGLFLYDSITGCITVGLAVYVLYLFFKRKKGFPKYFIYLYLYLITLNVVTLTILSAYSVSAEDMQENINDTTRTIIGGIIWGSYVVKSKRVKATFTKD